MKYETINNIQIPKIGFGSARLGGRFVRGILADRNHDDFFLSALRTALHPVPFHSALVRDKTGLISCKLVPASS